MENKTLFDKFTRQYQLSKTLKFELVPMGETERFIKEKGLLEKDEERADDYNKVKKLIDEYHKDFIEKALSYKKLSGLNDYLKEFTKTERDNKALSLLSESLRKEIAGWLKDNPVKDEKKLIEEKVPQFLNQQGRDSDAERVLKFKGFTIYFGGFNDNRKNIYSDKEQSTAIAYRIVHENLPKFISNINVFQRLTANYRIDFSEVESQLNGCILSDIFSLDYFNHCLTQSGIEKYNSTIGNVNKQINLFRQKNGLTNKQAPIMAVLYKQILSDRGNAADLFERYESAEDCLKAINEFYEKDIKAFASPMRGSKEIDVVDEIRKLLSEKLNTENDLFWIYIRNNFLPGVSQQLFGNYAVIVDALRFDFKRGKKETSKLEEETKRYLKKGYFSISEIESALKAYLQVTEIEDKEKRDEALKEPNPILHYFQAVTSNIEVSKDRKEKTELIPYLRQKYEAVQTVLHKQYENSELIQDNKAVPAIKDYLDSYLHILHFVKPLYVAPPKKDDSEMPEKDVAFYNEFDELFHQLNGSVIPLYNKVRSFLTQKPYSTEKFKLNFENKGNFLGGWVDSYTEDSDNGTQSGGYLFRKNNDIGEYDYYLGISNDKKLFRSHLQNEVMDKSEYERLDYYQLKTASVYGNSYVGENGYSSDKERLMEAIVQFAKSHDEALVAELNKYIEKGSPTPSGCFNLIKDKFPNYVAKLAAYGDFVNVNKEVVVNLKNTLNTLKRVPRASKYASKEYTFFSEVISDIELLAKEKSYSYFNVSQKELDEALQRSDKPLLLFKITNKDLSYAEQFSNGKRRSKGNDNLHTMYFKALVGGEQNVFDIGTGEVFFREKSLKYNEETMQKGHHAEKLKDKFNYPIISNRRFAYDKFQFHLSSILNYTKPNTKSSGFNDMVNQALKESNVNIIGIDRGERHLAYYTIINRHGEIISDDEGYVLQGSFNEIKNEHKGRIYNTDYIDKLRTREDERDKARKSWDSIGKIKELKEGYLSQVVHKIVQLMIKHNAVVVFEDLNFGFKRGRMKVERQVYQKLEKMLIDKLNYLAFKDHYPAAPGGILNAYQLAAPFTSFKDMGKQTGFIFYIPAANTSKIDFATGFMNFLYPKYENEKQAKEFFQKFDNIRFNPDKNYFEFVARYNNFLMDEKAKQEKDREWTICTHGRERWYYNIKSKSNRNEKPYLCSDVTENLKELLIKQNIDFESGKNIKKSIHEKGSASFFSSFVWNLRLLLQMRYCYKGVNGEEIDYILSPVYDDINKRFFDSRQAKETEPKDADANGAYHIALKGLLLLERMRRNKEVLKLNKNGKLDLSISNKEWYDFVQEQAYRR